jgi:DNA-binding beta-propeller fold protein YncE
VIGLLICCALLSAAPASASYEQVANFANNGESKQLQITTAMAVNTTGAGGVPAGTVYATGGRQVVARYNPDGKFSEAWGWNASVGGSEQFERCGPDGEAAHPVCKSGSEGGKFGEGDGQLSYPQGIAVDQSTGYVYVLNDPNEHREHNVVEVFSADGSQLITSFGEAGAFAETFDEGPENLHAPSTSGLAVDESGLVYISDYKIAPPESPELGTRVMVFEPQSPGDYQHYVYSGRANDIAATNGGIGYGPSHLALDDAGNLYTDTERDIYEFAPGEPDTPVCQFTIAAGGIAALTVNPQTGEPFYFSYKTKKINQLSACNSEGKFVPKDSFTPSPKPVDGGSIAGLAFNPDYAFSPTRSVGTLYAADPSELHGFGIGDIFARAEVIPPSVESESIASVTTTNATLKAQINPKGSLTNYVFQYLTEAEYEANEAGNRFAGATQAPVTPAFLGSGQSAISAAVAVTGLQPGTEYRYRAVASSHCDPDDEEAVCTGAGADASFHTFAVEAPGLPDGRAYELVSPTLKNGGEVFPIYPDKSSCGIECKPGVGGQPFPRQSTPDGEAVVYEGQPFSLTEGANVYNEYISRRTPSGWQTTVLAPKLMGGFGQGYKAFNADLSEGILAQGTPSLTPEAPSEVPNLYTQPTAAPSLLSPLLGSEPPNRPFGFQLAYAGASADFSRRFFAANGALTGETPVAPEAPDAGANKNNLYESAGGELRLVNVLPGNEEAAPGASFGAAPVTNNNYDDSASNLAHAISDDGSRVFWSDESGQVYVREDGQTTREIKTEGVPDSGRFLGASADGSKVLLANGHLHGLGDEEPTLDLTEGKGGFQGILGQSEDLSHVYFVDTAVLSGEEENQYGAAAQAGEFNLYAWKEGSLAFIATLIAADNNAAAGGDWHFSPAQRTAEASPDGRRVAFISQAPLSGYDNVGPTCSRNSVQELVSAPCPEVFLYDSASGKLSCASCNPSGQVPLGPSSLPFIPACCGTLDPLPQPRYLTDEGRLYFDSQDSLTPFDTNNRVEDVYQYEPQGVGTCKHEGGCVNLISAGHEPIDSNFVAIDKTGKSVFFTTRDQLVLKDQDQLIDLYVAREGGGIAAETETARGECQGEACQQAVTPPNDPTPGSSTFEGAGNVNEHKAAKKHKKHKHKHAKKKHAHKRAAKRNRGGVR